MPDITISYKDEPIATMSASGSKTLETGGKYCEDDIEVTYVKPSPVLQSKSATPTESAQTISPDSGYEGLSSVSVGAISSTYVGSGITQRDSTDLTSSGATVTAPAGYYAEAASTSVARGVKYVYSDVDGIGAWDVSGFEKCSVDGAPLNDGHLRLWFYFPSDAIPYSASVVIAFNRTAGSISIDWGDGSSPTAQTSSNLTATMSHTYTSAGLFVVDVTFISGNVQLYNTQGTWSPYIVAFEAHALNPQLRNGLMFPNMSNYSVLKSAWFGDELTTVGFLKGCKSLERVRLSSNTVNIVAQHFEGDSSLKTFVVPSSVSSIGKNAFKDCVSLEEIHLLPTTPPTLAANKQSSDSAFYNTPSDMIIYVPSGYLTAYQSATNWSTFASQMQEESL